jgi:hypothetical protein
MRPRSRQDSPARERRKASRENQSVVTLFSHSSKSAPAPAEITTVVDRDVKQVNSQALKSNSYLEVKLSGLERECFLFGASAEPPQFMPLLKGGTSYKVIPEVVH